MTSSARRRTFDRRTLLLGAGAVGLAACTSDSAPSLDTVVGTAPTVEPAGSVASSTTTSAPLVDAPIANDIPVDAEPIEPVVEQSVAALTASDFDGLATCALLPATTAGPFPNIERLDRSDITEGYPGHPLRLGVRVVDAACVPIPNATVEVWHADATGDYSSYDDNGDGKDEGSGTTFMRGLQTAGADGIVEFTTVYPGWYQGRAVHIHVAVEVDGQAALTTQVYFDEQYTEQIFAAGVYAEFGPPDTTWRSDRIIGNPASDGSGLALSSAPTVIGPGTLGVVNVGVSL